MRNIENGLIEWRDENNKMEDDGRMVKKSGNWVIRNQVKMRGYLKKIEQI